jgi:hypothetical protein
MAFPPPAIRLVLFALVSLAGLGALGGLSEARWSTLADEDVIANTLQACQNGAKFQIADGTSQGDSHPHARPPGSPDSIAKHIVVATQDQFPPTPESTRADQTLTIPYNPIDADVFGTVHHLDYSGTFTVLWSQSVPAGTALDVWLDPGVWTISFPVFVGACTLSTPPYEIPAAASPVKVGLIPTYRQCGTAQNPANTTHGLPDMPGGQNPDQSCTPATPTAAVARAGAQANGSAIIDVIPQPVGNPAFYPAESDVTFAVNVTDVRSGTPTGPEYNPNAGGPDLTLAGRWRITDTYNGPSLGEAATVAELDFPVPVDCQPTADPGIGSTCTANTSANAIMPGAIRKGKSASIQFFRVRLNDAGADGVRGNGDDTIFEQEGVAVAQVARRILFHSNRSGNFEVWAMNPDGSGASNISNDPADDSWPAWSPSGRKIAFVSNRDGNSEIYIMNSDGSGQTRLTDTPQSEDHPSFSEDGGKIVFSSTRDGNEEIYVMNADGSNEVRLTNTGATDTIPVFSPNGQKIAFVSDRSGAQQDVWVMNADGSSPTPLTTNAATDSRPAFSSDGTKIAFMSNRDGNYEIYTMTSSGSSQTRLTTNASFDADPTFSPDGQRIAFATDRDGNFNIYRMDAVGGTNQAPLTTNAAWDAGPSWARGTKPTSDTNVSLVPAFRQCGTATNPSNRTHGAPLSSASCNPPVPGASVARVGGHAVGFADLFDVPGDPTTATDEANISIAGGASDVRSGTTTGPDYNPSAGGPDLTLVARLRITDNYNGAALTSSGTLTDLDFPVPVDCATTALASIGSFCTVKTSADALIPNLVKEGKGLSWQVFRLRLNDSGANNIRGDSDDTLFEQQGLFVP